MAVTATFLPDLSRVRVAFTGLSTDADYALVERSADGGIRWDTVRGGSRVPVTAGAGRLDDYEFRNRVPNIYRVTAVDTQPQSWVGAGAPVSSGSPQAILSPASPGGTQKGDLLILHASVRGESGYINTPAGWASLGGTGNHRLFSAVSAAAGSAAVDVSFTGETDRDSIIAQVHAFRNTDQTPWEAPVVQRNPASGVPEVPWPDATPAGAPSLAVVASWRQAAWEGPASTNPALAVWGEESVPSDSGAGMAQSLHGAARSGSSQFPGGVVSGTSKASAVSQSLVLFLRPRVFTNSETAEVTPSEDRVVLVNLGRPSLNLYPETVSVSSIKRKSRAGVFPVQGRTNPVAVTDVHSSREFTVDMDIIGFDEQDDIDLKLASGQPVYLRVPENQFLPECYISLGDYEIQQDAKASRSMTVSVAMTEIARPGDSVYGDTYVWADVTTDYLQWLDVLSTPVSATWTNLIDRVGSSEVIVG